MLHQRWMSEALRQARKGRFTTDPNPRVGCVVVAGDELIASGWHEFTGGPHAEVNAIASARVPAGADFYVTLEPCSHHGRTPPCVDALITQKPARVIVAMQDPNPQVAGRGLEKLRASGIEVIESVLESEARELNRGFIKRMEQGMPFASVKTAVSLDGRSALKNGRSQWITGAAARRDVQFLRAQSSAILSSAQTVIDDDPRLNVRLSKQDLQQRLEVRQPLRVVVDSKLRLAGTEQLFDSDGEICIYTLSADEDKTNRLIAAGAEVKRLEESAAGHMCLQAMMRDLAAGGINEVHTECGQGLAGALINQGLVDQIVIYMAPHLLGSQARGMFELGELGDMQQRKNCKFVDIRSVGNDLRLTLTLENN